MTAVMISNESGGLINHQNHSKMKTESLSIQAQMLSSIAENKKQVITLSFEVRLVRHVLLDICISRFCVEIM